MDSDAVRLRHPALAAAAPNIVEDLERGTLVPLGPCPFPLPTPDNRAFLLEQRLKSAGRRSISYEAQSHCAHGYVRRGPAQADRLRHVLADAADMAGHWLSMFLPRYAARWEFDYVAFHPDEEATRKLRPSERHDLLHIDHSPKRPTLGRRLLRLFVNLHSTDPRVWLTAQPVRELLPRFGPQVQSRSSRRTWWAPLRDCWRKVLGRSCEPLSPHDEFLIAVDYVLRHDDNFQERSAKKCWHFAPDTAWLAFTDGLCHAELRGRSMLEFAWFVAPESLARPDLSPFTPFQPAPLPTPAPRAA